jgi:hypothetical protein
VSDEADPDDAEDDEFSRNVLQSMSDVFWEPEIERRGGVEVTGQLRKALAVLAPGRPVEVFLNDDAELVCSIPADPAIEAGQKVELSGLDEVSDLRPLTVDPDAG